MAMHSATSGASKRLKAFIKSQEKSKGICIACVCKRIKTVKVNTYRETHSDEMLTALKPGKNVQHFHEDDININRRNIIIKVNDGPIYLLDQYLCSTLEKEMKSRPGSICRHVIYLKYDDTSDRFTETRRTGNKVEGRRNTAIDNSDVTRELCKNQIHPCSLTSKGKNKERLTCINQQLDCDIVHSKHVYPFIDAMYNIPLIRDRESSNHNDHHSSERSTSNYHLQYLRHPLFCEYPTRLSTFRNWRHCLDPKMLAENGFFYQENNNFKYGTIVYDKPLINYEEDSLQNGQHSKDSANLSVDPASEPKGGCRSHKGASIQHASETRSDFLDTSATDRVLEMGFSRKDVCLAIKELNKKGLSLPTAKQILDIIFDDQDSRLFLKSKNH